MLTARAEDWGRAAAPTILVLAMVLAAGGLTYWGRDQVISGDALFYAQRLSDHDLGHVILRSNLYLIALPMVLYKAMFEVFGIDSYLPYRLAAIILALLCAGLFYVIARRRIGHLLALAPTILLLFFGSGWEVLITGMRIPSLFAIASGLGAVLLLEREDRRRDAWAAALLCVSVTSHPTGVAFVAAATVMVAFRPSARRWASSWIVLIPAALFGAFLVFFQHTAEEGPGTGVLDVLDFARDSWTTLVAAVSGLSGVIDAPVQDRFVAVIASIAVLAVILAGGALRWRRLRPTFWAAVAALVTLVVATRMSPGGFIRIGLPGAPRYLYPEAVLFLWILVELAGGWRDAGVARTRTVVAGLATGILLLGLWSNITKLGDAGATLRTASTTSRGEYSAYELAQGRLNSSYRPNPFAPSAGEYLSAAAAYGSAGLSPSELAGASALERASADRSLVGSLGLGLTATQRRRPPRTCVVGRDFAELQLAPGGAWIGGERLAQATFALGRFANAPIVRRAPEAASQAAALRIPRDGADVPWRLQVASPKPVTICGLPGG